MLEAAVKTLLASTISFFLFILAPQFFPFTLLGVALVIATPVLLGVWRTERARAPRPRKVQKGSPQAAPAPSGPAVASAPPA